MSFFFLEDKKFKLYFLIFLKENTSSIDNILRDKSFFYQGLGEVIAESSKRIQIIKGEITKIKVNSSHILYDYISNIIEILEDDINQRIKVYLI